MEVFCRVSALYARWFRYRCFGYENIPRDRSTLLAGYHGRPAFDMFMLMALLWRRERKAAFGIAHRVLFRSRRAAALLNGLGMYDGSDAATREITARGDHVAVLPGGTQECFRSSRTLYRVDWGRHRGYLRFALRHGLPIVPVASSGVDEFLHIIGEGYLNSMRILHTDVVPLCLPLGLGGLPFPLGQPRPVSVRQLVGPPIDLSIDPAADPDDPGWVEAAHARVSGAVQELLDRAVAGGMPPAAWGER